MLTGRAIAASIVGGVMMVATASMAAADDPWVRTECSDGARASCTTEAGTKGSKATKRQRSNRNPVQSASNRRVCKDSDGVTVACSEPSLGNWDNQSGCYLKPASPTRQQAAAFGNIAKGSGAWYDATCFELGGNGGGLAWRAAGPEGEAQAPPPPPPVVLARQAVDRLTLVSPKIGASPSPGGEQLVSLPTWLWLQDGSWEPQSATASVPGVSVTATATPTNVTWSMGDGRTLECDGPGTVFPAAGDPRASSPTCGHTYTQSSAGRSGSAFPVTATVSWAITWAGGGQQGALPAMETTAATTFRVAESQALIGPGSASG